MDQSDLWSGTREERHVGASSRWRSGCVRARSRVCGSAAHLGPGKLLRRMLEADVITSLIPRPPGTGKDDPPRN